MKRTTTLVNFWEGALNQTIHPTQARMWGKIILRDAVNVKGFPSSVRGTSGMSRLRQNTFPRRVYFRITGTRGI